MSLRKTRVTKLQCRRGAQARLYHLIVVALMVCRGSMQVVTTLLNAFVILHVRVYHSSLITGARWSYPREAGSPKQITSQFYLTFDFQTQKSSLSLTSSVVWCPAAMSYSGRLLSASSSGPLFHGSCFMRVLDSMVQEQGEPHGGAGRGSVFVGYLYIWLFPNSSLK